MEQKEIPTVQEAKTITASELMDAMVAGEKVYATTARTMCAIDVLNRFEIFREGCLKWTDDFYLMNHRLSEEEAAKRTKSLIQQLSRGFNCISDVLKNKIAESIHEEAIFQAKFFKMVEEQAEAENEKNDVK